MPVRAVRGGKARGKEGLEGEAHACGEGGEEEAADDGGGDGAEVDVDVSLEMCRWGCGVRGRWLGLVVVGLWGGRGLDFFFDDFDLDAELEVHEVVGGGGGLGRGGSVVAGGLRCAGLDGCEPGFFAGGEGALVDAVVDAADVGQGAEGHHHAWGPEGAVLGGALSVHEEEHGEDGEYVVCVGGP